MSGKRSAILALDQGTTSSRAVVFSPDGKVISLSQEEFPQIYPHAGWVEHDPEVIWATVLTTAREALKKAEAQGWRAQAIGVTNQRETTIVWDRSTGIPVHNAIVWQDRRTADTCAALDQAGHAQRVTEKTGLVLDPYFSATKIAWILDHVDGARARAEAGDLIFGTVDTWLIWRLTGGEVHATDATNASRTSLYEIGAGHWDEELLSLFNVPASVLPDVRDCAGNFGTSKPGVLERPLAITGVAGDQQAASIGQACFSPGDLKSTYGTGAFMMLTCGDQLTRSSNQFLSTIAYRIDGRTAYALEGSILSAGSTVQWLRDGLGLITKAVDIEALAAAADPQSRVFLVPAFTGLGAPHWDPDARAAIVGLSRGVGRAEIAQAAIDATVHQTCDLLEAMTRDGVAARSLKVDGGMTLNNRFLQRLADFTEVDVVRPVNTETTAWGAAFLAGLGCGMIENLSDGVALWQADRHFSPTCQDDVRLSARAGWAEAVARVRSN